MHTRTQIVQVICTGQPDLGAPPWAAYTTFTSCLAVFLGTGQVPLSRHTRKHRQIPSLSSSPSFFNTPLRSISVHTALSPSSLTVAFFGLLVLLTIMGFSSRYLRIPRPEVSP